MWNKKLISFLIFISIIFLGNLSLVAEPTSLDEPTTYQLKWMEVEGASGYAIEIRNSNGYMVVSERVDKTSFDLVNFTSGAYEHRVAVVNKLGKVGSFSEWVKFEVVVSKIPSLTKNSVYSVSKEEKEKVLLLEGNDFIHPMKVFMIASGKKIQAKSVVVESGKIAKATFSIDATTDTGIYDLVLENPRKKTLTAKQRVVLSDSKEKADRFAKRQEKVLNKEIPEDYYTTPYWSTLWRSSLIPGWGQKYIDGKDWKLYVYPLVAIGVGALYANSYQKFLSARSNYESSVLLGLFLANEPSAQAVWLVNRNAAESSFNSAKQELQTLQIGAGVLGIFLAYNILDSYFSAKRNVASNQLEFPIFEDSKQVRTRVSADLPQFGLSMNRNIGSRYELEFFYNY
ncbi:hypothetical protein P3G55_02775 [Leptospira sp. 96542]|nr:hypothetical protein [Leptospira sp. 96542]